MLAQFVDSEGAGGFNPLKESKMNAAFRPGYLPPLALESPRSIIVKRLATQGE
jgi:hypothetical protein